MGLFDQVVGNLAARALGGKGNEGGIIELVLPLLNKYPGGIAGLCSADGRHLAVMPHPERVFLPWQAHYLPESMRHLQVSPWLLMFQNAYRWCQES